MSNTGIKSVETDMNKESIPEWQGADMSELTFAIFLRGLFSVETWKTIGHRMIEYFKARKAVLMTTWICALLAYVFMFTNKIPSHDECWNLFNKGATLGSGRWGLILCSLIFPDVSMPWIYGILTIAIFSVSICLMLDIIHIRSKVMQCLLGGLVIVFPALIGTFAFMFTATSYAISFLAAVVSVILVQKATKLWHWAVSVILMVFSVSIYQAYLPVTAGLFVLTAIQELLENTDIKRVVCNGLKKIAFWLYLLPVIGC